MTATVSASALALHLDCSRAYLGKLEAEGVIQPQSDGFLLDQSRVAYLRYLRREHKRSPRAEADADHVKVKTEMLQRLAALEAPWPPVESYTENPTCCPSRFPSCFSPKIFALEVYLYG
jgi:hypothetical protein